MAKSYRHFIQLCYSMRRQVGILPWESTDLAFYAFGGEVQQFSSIFIPVCLNSLFFVGKMKNLPQSWYDKNVMCIINGSYGFSYKVQGPVSGQRRK